MSKKKQEKRKKNRLAQQSYIQQEWERGRLMKESKCGEFYSKEYTRELEKRLLTEIYKYLNSSTSDQAFLHNFLTLKNHIRDLVIWRNPEVEKGIDYTFLRKCLETYWDLKDKSSLLTKLRELWNSLMPL